MSSLPLLSLFIWLPIIGAMLVLISGEQRVNVTRGIAVVITFSTFLLSIPFYLNFDVSRYDMQFVEVYKWIPTYNIQYALGVDGISLLMIILTNFTGLLVVIAACTAIKKRVAQYMAAFLILQGMIVGVFAAMDAVLFYIFWEGMLIPMYLSIGMWGSSNRNYASIKFFLFTFSGSILMLVALVYLYMQTHSFLIQDYYGLPLAPHIQNLLFIAFALAFAVKVPMIPIHTWLPDAHTEAPAGGSVVLAALMLKLGIYGFLRFSLPILPLASQRFAGLMIVLSLVAIVYISLIAIIQKDMKKLIAYSSIAHMGFATLACFMVFKIAGPMEMAYMSIEAAVILMISHAFSSGGMFLGVGLMADRFYNYSRLIKDYGGLASTMPIFSAFFLLFAMSNVGLPGTSGFVGEFMIIMSAFQTNFWVAFFASTSLILSAAYTLWMYKRVFFGPLANEHVAAFKDITWSEKLNFSMLAIAILFIGIYPNSIINVLQATAQHLVIQSMPIG